MCNIPKVNVRVLLIEDDPMFQEVNRMFIEHVEGFIVVGTASNGLEGLRMIEELKPDLVFLDVYMPLLDGMDTLQHIRNQALPVDIVVVTAAKETETLRIMMRNGAVDYIIKPFKLERVRQTLERYRARFDTLAGEHSVTQEGLDRILLIGEAVHDSGAVETSHDHKQLQEQEESVIELPSANRLIPVLDVSLDDLPKGLNINTLKQVLAVLTQRGGNLSAEEMAEGVGIARVTARRYLDYLSKVGYVELEVNYGGIGRPINRYVLRSRTK